ncbi:g7797 [Coccomyxa viridis]|uniref:G7782 protein n=1 Tax=Coccomyxa viridis TaxID=1274662 RepID=A0ABP1G2T8_9CHLO
MGADWRGNPRTISSCIQRCFESSAQHTAQLANGSRRDMACKVQDNKQTFFNDQPGLAWPCTPDGQWIEDTTPISNETVRVCTQHAICFSCKKRKNSLQVVSYKARSGGRYCNLICKGCRFGRPAAAFGVGFAAPLVVTVCILQPHNIPHVVEVVSHAAKHARVERMPERLC